MAARASSLVEVNSDEDRTSSSPGGASSVGGKKMMERTESLVSDVLSFYSMDGLNDDGRASSKVSFGGLTSPQSLRSQGCNSIDIFIGPESGPEPDPSHFWSFENI